MNSLCSQASSLSPSMIISLRTIVGSARAFAVSFTTSILVGWTVAAAWLRRSRSWSAVRLAAVGSILLAMMSIPIDPMFTVRTNGAWTGWCIFFCWNHRQHLKVLAGGHGDQLMLDLSQCNWRHIIRHEIRAAEPAKTVRRLVGLILWLIADFVGVSVPKHQLSAEKLSSSEDV